MSAELPPELRSAVNQPHGLPLHLVDPETNAQYVLIPAADYHPPTDEPVGDDDLAATYPAQFAAATEAGWDEPEMADYDDYDAHRKNK